MKSVPTLALTLLAAPALAGGPTSTGGEPAAAAAAPVPVIRDWSGPYVGLSFGRSSGDLTATDGIVTDSVDYETTSAGGIFAGYSDQHGRLVFGGEFAYSSTSIEIIADGDDFLESLLDLRGRVGYAVGRALVYGTVGFSRAKFDVNGGADRFTANGVSYGLGVDYAVTERLSIGLDYLRRDLDGTNDNPINTFDADTTVSTVALRATFSF